MGYLVDTKEKAFQMLISAIHPCLAHRDAKGKRKREIEQEAMDDESEEKGKRKKEIEKEAPAKYTGVVWAV